MAYDKRFASRLTGPVDRRLRMYALVKGKTITGALVDLLDEALPSAEDLALALSGPQSVPTETAGAVA